MTVKRVNSTSIAEDIEEKKSKGISLTEYLSSIGRVVESNFSESQWVKCEISSINNSRGFTYIELVDKTSDNRRVKSQTGIINPQKQHIVDNFVNNTGIQLSSGMQVLLLLKCSFKAQFGLSFFIDDIDPYFTVGELEMKYKAIRNKMNQANISRLNINLQPPKHFSKIAVISPSAAAGLGDFKIEADILERNNICEFDYFEATFEGVNTENTITQAFTSIFKKGLENYDCIVFIRGGGAKSSLQFLNEEKIVYCVCKINIPVFVGVGHEKDSVLIDEFANRSFDTPSKVIEYISNVNFDNFLNAETNIKNTYNLIYQATEYYQKTVESSFFEIHSILISNLDSLESKISMNFQNIDSKLSSNIDSFENIIKSNFKEIDSNIVSSLDVFKNDTINNSNNIRNLVFENLTGYESRAKFLTQEINSGLISLLNNYSSNIKNNKEHIESDIMNHLDSYKNNINSYSEQIFNYLFNILDMKEHEVNMIMRGIKEIDPRKLLDRGYAIIKSENNIIDSIKELESLDKVKVLMKDGELEFLINKVSK